MVHHIKYIALLFIFLTCWACTTPQEKKDKPPVVIISETYDQEKFAAILFDLTMVEAAFRLNMADQESVVGRDSIYRNILLSHETDSTVFEENWTYYGYRPEEMQEVYDLVLAKIDQERIARGAQPIKKIEDE